MIKAEKSDKATVTDILSSAFSENRSVNYVIPQDEKKMQRIRKLMAYSFDVCFAFGEVYLSDCRRACALVLYPGRKRITLQSISWDIRLAITVFGLSRTAKVLSREQSIKKHHPPGNIFYCWYIGVQQGFQRNGTGRQLLHELLQKSEELKLPVYLETSTPENVPWYQRAGFEVYAEEKFGYRLFFLRKL
jgi:GNAT superfamily N-acetyltransferase